MHILLVDDEPTVRAVVAEMFEDEGFTVAQAENGELGLAALQADPTIQALVTDVRMPGSVDGWELAARARLHRPSMPVFVVSGYAGEGREIHDPLTVFRTKPYYPDEIATALRAMVAG